MNRIDLINIIKYNYLIKNEFIGKTDIEISNSLFLYSGNLINMSSLRLSEYGIYILSKIFICYNHEIKINDFKAKYVLLFKNYPWGYFKRNIIIFDENIIFELKLFGDLERYYEFKKENGLLLNIEKTI